ncbi:carboxypeptidase Y [Colletotrichum chrysophilum]|uniref:carboxypeptidase C n=1 Tax=Colletotrichum chrysophilum TaxID=1836956 RepID=A0AAD9E815_9PEZI|nr:carboxypeptidase Y [Colletotrichum chrysophilum]
MTVTTLFPALCYVLSWWIVTRQDDRLCDAGSRQWTGFVPVNRNREMFFWYFESRNNPQTAPLLIWVNGGPGGSSLLGAFYELGPCKINEAGNSTTRNAFSWTNFANVVFIDQPIGVGFSYTNDSNLWAHDLNEAENDFNKFLDIFLDDVFPELSNKSIHFAGESFGGQYVPTYVSRLRRRLDSIILVNALVSFPKVVLGLYEHFCVPTSVQGVELSVSRRGFNHTECAKMAAGYPTCEAAYGACKPVEDVVMNKVTPGGLNPYDDRVDCIEPPLCGRLGMEEITKYLNQAHVQKQIGVENQIDFKTVNMDMNEQWSKASELFVPTSREVAAILDKKHTRVLVINGNNDIIVNTEGVKRIFDDLLWEGQAQFRAEPWVSLHFQEPLGNRIHVGISKTSGNLSIVTVDEAGHIVPHDQPEAVMLVVKNWAMHGSVWPQEHRSPFETAVI